MIDNTLANRILYRRIDNIYKRMYPLCGDEFRELPNCEFAIKKCKDCFLILHLAKCEPYIIGKRIYSNYIYILNSSGDLTLVHSNFNYQFIFDRDSFVPLLNFKFGTLIMPNLKRYYKENINIINNKSQYFYNLLLEYFDDNYNSRKNFCISWIFDINNYEWLELNSDKYIVIKFLCDSSQIFICKLCDIHYINDSTIQIGNIIVLRKYSHKKSYYFECEIYRKDAYPLSLRIKSISDLSFIDIDDNLLFEIDNLRKIGDYHHLLITE